MSFKLLTSHLNTNEDIFTDDEYIFKISKKGISKKILAERSYYEFISYIAKRYSRFYPVYLGYEVVSGKNLIKLEYLKNYKTLSYLLLRVKHLTQRV